MVLLDAIVKEVVLYDINRGNGKTDKRYQVCFMVGQKYIKLYCFGRSKDGWFVNRSRKESYWENVLEK